MVGEGQPYATEEELCLDILAMFEAGTSTTGHTVSAALILAAKYPAVQDEVAQKALALAAASAEVKEDERIQIDGIWYTRGRRTRNCWMQEVGDGRKPLAAWQQEELKLPA